VALDLSGVLAGSASGYLVWAPSANFVRQTSQSFSVAEFAQLVDGTRVFLHDERGFTIGAPSGRLRHVTAETIVESVLNTVLPDDDESSDEHPWTWLASLAQTHNLDVTSEELRHLPYVVVLSDNVRNWLSLTQD
jgi:hypothetical protein